MRDKNDDYLQRLKAVECPDATFLADTPALVFAKAQGSKIWDVEENEYVDLCAGFGALALGHNPEEFRTIWQDQAYGRPGAMLQGMGDVYPSVDKIEFIETLLSVLPSYLSSAALALSGSQAVEIAVKTALLASGKSGFISFRGAYHGLDFGTLALTSREDFRKPFASWTAASQVCFCDYGGSLEDLRSQFKRAVKDLDKSYGVAAAIVEPIQGRGGVRVPPDHWLETLRELCDEHGILLIFDEVFTGLGRCGVYTHADAVPCDILCLGKALGGGMPLSACVGSRKVMSYWPDNSGEAIHTGTFFGHPLSCRIGTRVIDTLKREDLLSRSEKVRTNAIRYLNERFEEKGFKAKIQGKGLMLGIKFEKPGIAVTYMNQLRARGVIALPSGDQGDVLSITPALNIDESLLRAALAECCQTFFQS